jgi:hypothetical protein
MKNSWKILIAFILPILASSNHQALASPSTADFMNAMTVCGGGASVQIDANLKGSLKSVYEGEATQGRIVQEIIPKIAEYLPDSDNYKQYLDCLSKLLTS